MSHEIHRTYQALVEAAVKATGAESGWLLRIDDATLTVTAAVGGDDPSSSIGTLRSATGATGHALAAGYPTALRVRNDDHSNDGVGGAIGVPSSVLSAPCNDGDVVGVLEVANAQSGSFSFDDVEVVSLLADIAGAALADQGNAGVSVPSPAELSSELSSLAQRDPLRYASVATVVVAMLSSS